MDFSPELLQKARCAGSAAELEALAEAESLTLTAGEAETYFAKLHPPVGELADEELDSVSGGGCGGRGGVQQVGSRLMNGMVVNIGNETHCQKCGHQGTFQVWDVSPTGNGYHVGKIECTACHTIYVDRDGTFEKAQDQTSPGGFGPVMA